MRRLALERLALLRPVLLNVCKCFIDVAKFRVLALDLAANSAIAIAKHEHQSRLFARSERDALVQRAAVIASEFSGAIAASLHEGDGISFRVIVAEETVAHRV